MHKYYRIDSEVNNEGVVTSIAWKQKPVKKNEGYYLLRTTLDQKDEKTQWTIYNTIREIEATFRTLKTDLDLRPIYHKTDKASMAHLHLGLLAYWAVNTIRHQFKQKDINNEWRDIVRIMNTQKIVTTTMDNDYDQQIIIRQCSEPTEQVNKIYTALKFKPKPFTRKKSVVPPAEVKKTEKLAKTQFFSDYLQCGLIVLFLWPIPVKVFCGWCYAACNCRFFAARPVPAPAVSPYQKRICRKGSYF
jgi:hypothetical protein